MKKNKNINYKKINLIILKNIYVFPKNVIKVKLVNKIFIETINNIVSKGFTKQFLLVSEKFENNENNLIKNIFNIGTICNFNIIKKDLKEKNLEIEIFGLERIKVSNVQENDGFFSANFEILKDKRLSIKDKKWLSERFFEKIKLINKELALKIQEKLFTKNEITSFIYLVLNSYSHDKKNLKQKALETDSIIERYKLLESFDNINNIKNIDLMKIIDNQIDNIVKNKLSKQQRFFLLREKLKVINKELGNFDPRNKSVSNYLKRLETEEFPETIKIRMKEEIEKLQEIPPSSGESNIIKSYIDWVMCLPWNVYTKQNNNLNEAKKILDSSHFGLKKTKQIIIEHLASNIYSKENSGQIICFIGPSGTGKTSLGKSIAKAFGRKYIRIALGGVKDESEIRGHRKTYLGSMPGKIIKSIRKVGTKNPLILIDEIDKLSSDYRGDPSSAMLEVLDPEQNSTFSDNYIEEPFDLSKVLFIATANYEYDIPSALRDRMEIIELSSYTEYEKLNIAIKHLVPKIYKKLKLNKKQIEFEKSSILEIIKYYTREAGVRELNRLIEKICKKIIVSLLINKEKYTKKIIKNSNVYKYLEKRIYEHTLKNKESEIGIVTGLAYTQFGGDILPIETTKFSGSGKLILTGKLGEIMKESANIALGYIKSNTLKFKINSEIFKEIDIHIHVPEGAVPKDGPSAGITLTTALISLFKNKSVSSFIGMTGEITLTGKVLPIGGLKEKAISAARSQLKTILIPKQNKKDLDEIPEEVKKVLEIILVSDYSDVFSIIFEK